MMFNFRKFSPLLLGLSLVVISCEKEEIIDAEVLVPAEEYIAPVDFRYLTLNSAGHSTGGKSTISYIHQDGTFSLNHFKTANGVDMQSDSKDAFQIGNKLFLIQKNSDIYEMDPNSFKLTRTIKNEVEFSPSDMANLGGDSVLVVGSTSKDTSTPTVVVGDLKGDSFIKRSFNTDFTVHKAVRVGNKIFTAGERTQYFDYEAFEIIWTYSKLAVMDIDNISKDSIRTIVDKVDISSSNSNLCVDKNNNLWFINKENESLKLYGIDTEKEVVIHTIDLPNTTSVYDETAYDINVKNNEIYIRSKKAFYVISLDNPVAPDEPNYEYMGHVTLTDLKVTKEGNLLVIDEYGGKEKSSSMIELTPSKEKEWSVVSEHDVDMNARSIYISNYETK